MSSLSFNSFQLKQDVLRISCSSQGDGYAVSTLRAKYVKVFPRGAL